MRLFSKLSLNPEDPAAVLGSIQYAFDIGLRLKPRDLLPDHIQELVQGIDHIGFTVGIQALPAIFQYQKDCGYFLRSFESTIASKEFANVLTIYELKGGSIPLEIMVPIDHSKAYPQHHIAFSVCKEEHLEAILFLFGERMRMPAFMKGPMKNQKRNVSIIYLDGGPVRLEFIYIRPD